MPLLDNILDSNSGEKKLYSILRGHVCHKLHLAITLQILAQFTRSKMHLKAFKKTFLTMPNVMNHDIRTFLFYFYFLFLEWTYIIREVTLMSHNHHGKVVHRPSRIDINSVLKSSGDSNEFSLSTLT